jgi:hypothetical protein
LLRLAEVKADTEKMVAGTSEMWGIMIGETVGAIHQSTND